MSEPADHDDDRGHLEAILHSALGAGVRVQMSGGDTARVYDIMERIARSLGADRVQGSVTSVIVGLTVHRGEWSRTAIHRTPHIGVNFTELSETSVLAQRAGGMTDEAIRDQLARVRSTQRKYPTGLAMAMLGIACAAFAALFDADGMGIAIAGLAGFAGAFVRHLLAQQQFKPFVFCLAAAFTSTSVVAILAGLTQTPRAAVAACVLYLVPGVPLLNGTADLLASHYLNGLVRLTMAVLIVLASGIGVGIAFGLWGRII